MILASFMLAISSIVISAIAYLYANELDGKYNNMIDYFDHIETKMRYEREIIFNNLRFLRKTQKTTKSKKPKKVVKKNGKNTKRSKLQRKKI